LDSVQRLAEQSTAPLPALGLDQFNLCEFEIAKDTDPTGVLQTIVRMPRYGERYDLPLIPTPYSLRLGK
jgi:hypothetical protein